MQHTDNSLHYMDCDLWIVKLVMMTVHKAIVSLSVFLMQMVLNLFGPPPGPLGVSLLAARKAVTMAAASTPRGMDPELKGALWLMKLPVKLVALTMMILLCKLRLLVSPGSTSRRPLYAQRRPAWNFVGQLPTPLGLVVFAPSSPRAWSHVMSAGNSQDPRARGARLGSVWDARGKTCNV